MTELTDREVRRRYPFLPFHLPVHVEFPDVKGWACRLCIAKRGLTRGNAELFETVEAWSEHYEKEHTTRGGK